MIIRKVKQHQSIFTVSFHYDKGVWQGNTNVLVSINLRIFHTFTQLLRNLLTRVISSFFHHFISSLSEELGIVGAYIHITTFSLRGMGQKNWGNIELYYIRTFLYVYTELADERTCLFHSLEGYRP